MENDTVAAGQQHRSTNHSFLRDDSLGDGVQRFTRVLGINRYHAQKESSQAGCNHRDEL
jgi:hypothetical protein